MVRTTRKDHSNQPWLTEQQQRACVCNIVIPPARDARQLAGDMKAATPRDILLAELEQWLRQVPKGDWRAFISKDEVKLILGMAAQLRDYEGRNIAANIEAKRWVRANQSQAARAYRASHRKRHNQHEECTQ